MCGGPDADRIELGLFPGTRATRGGFVTNQASSGGIQVNQRLAVGGGVLIGIGSLLGFTGVMLLTSAIVSAFRRWVKQLELPPREMAKQRWQQARAATSAGAEAWRSGPPAGSS
jgi:hypothetical protein